MTERSQLEALLIALNIHGVRIAGHQRVRLTIAFDADPETRHLVIVPTAPPEPTPFEVSGDRLYLDDVPVARISAAEVDDAVGGYFRDGGRAITLNPASRSACTGCAFCPNTLEAASDPRLAADADLDRLFDGLAAAHPVGTLEGVRDVVVSSGCFEREDIAVDYLGRVRRAMRRAGLDATLGVLTSVVRSRQAFERLAAEGPTMVWLTVECFTRRALLLKDTKSSLQVDQVPDVLAAAGQAGAVPTITYIVGLDTMDVAVDGMRPIAPLLGLFPNLQVYQAHTPAMARLRTPGAGSLAWMLEARSRFEEVLLPTGLRPVPWRNYRPLWHYTYGGRPIDGCRI